MGFLGRLLGNPVDLSKTVEAVGNGFDRFIYTKEEKAEDYAKTVTEGRQMLVKWMESTQGQNLSRRIISLSITLVWLLMYLTRMCLSMAAIWMDHTKEFNASAQIIGDNIEQMNGAVMLILGFYFASPYLGKIAESAMQKFGKESK